MKLREVVAHLHRADFAGVLLGLSFPTDRANHHDVRPGKVHGEEVKGRC